MARRCGRDLNTPKLNQPEPVVASTELENFRVGRGCLHCIRAPSLAAQVAPGRPKGSKNRLTLFSDAFDTPHSVVDNGKKNRLSAQALGYLQLAHKVAKGGLKASWR
jgi:hypothetical protein